MKLRIASDYMYHGKTSDLAIMDERCVALYKERAENGEYKGDGQVHFSNQNKPYQTGILFSLGIG